MAPSQTYHDLLEEIGFCDSPEYLSIDSADIRPRDRHFVEWGRDKIRADGVVLQRTSVVDSCFPLVYFRQLEDDDPRIIAHAHKLAWNMGRAPLLVLVLPGRVLVYSTYERPRPRLRDGKLDERAGLIDTIDFVANAERARQILRKYSREELLSGRFWESSETRKRFNPKTRVEKSLLDNLSAIRSLLIENNETNQLGAPIVHSLLGRAIFIQYLQDRKDPQGYCAFPQDYFDRFLSGATCFPDVLSNKRATYRYFVNSTLKA